MKAKNIAKKIALIVPLIVGMQTASATNRLSVTKNASQQSVLFNYEWENQDRQLSRISFNINNKNLLTTDIFKINDSQIEKEHQAKMREVENEINKRAGYGMLTMKLNEDLTISYRYPSSYEGTDQLASAMKLAKQILDQNLGKLGRFVNVNEALLLNYETLTKNSMSQTAPIAQAFAAKHRNTPPRAAINDILSFYQSIPYDPLRKSQHGFINTNEMIAKNKGDCDSKSVSFVSTIKNLYPNISAIIVTINGHALVGLNAPRTPQDRVIKYKNIEYVLAEPVGPSKMKLGSIGNKSAIEIKNKRFRIFII